MRYTILGYAGASLALLCGAMMIVLSNGDPIATGAGAFYVGWNSGMLFALWRPTR